MNTGKIIAGIIVAIAAVAFFSIFLVKDVDFVLGQLGHPRYQGPRYTQYKTKGLVRSPYETLF